MVKIGFVLSNKLANQKKIMELHKF